MKRIHLRARVRAFAWVAGMSVAYILASASAGQAVGAHNGLLTEWRHAMASAAGWFRALQPDRTTGTAARATEPGRPETAVSAAPGDVPDAVVTQITQALAKVVDVTELVVTPRASGGYDVSAEVDLSAAPDARIQQVVRSDVDALFPALYRMPLPLHSAQVYFFVDGRLIGGAQLDRDVYQKLAAAAAGGNTDLANQLAHTSATEGSGGWFAVQRLSGNPTM